MALLFTTTSTSISAENKRPKIVIVGAGLAGLTTAYRLQQKGMDVHLYEVRNRVGGRIFTVKIGGSIAELGGLNIRDGGEAKNIQRLIEEFGLESTEYKRKINISYFTGTEFLSIQQLLGGRQFQPEDLWLRLSDVAKKSKNMRDVLGGIFEKDDPLYKLLAVRLAGYEGASIEKLSPIYAETLYHMILGGICAAHSADGDTENYIKFLCLKEGNASLPERLAQVLGDRVHLNMPLKKVAKHIDNSYDLTFQNGLKVAADILVLAIPCSVYEGITFEENVLPQTTLDQIKSIQYGTNAKILVPFSMQPLDKPEVGFVNDRISCFRDMNTNISTLYYTGIASQFTAETISDTYVQDRAMLEMGYGDMWPPYVAPTYAKDQAYDIYAGPVGYSWPNDPYVKGSYSYIAPGQEAIMTTMKEELGESVKTMFAPIDQTLYFAGEHTSILMQAPGTMEAACESGERAARMILNFFGNFQSWE